MTLSEGPGLRRNWRAQATWRHACMYRNLSSRHRACQTSHCAGVVKTDLEGALISGDEAPDGSGNGPEASLEGQQGQEPSAEQNTLPRFGSHHFLPAKNTNSCQPRVPHSDLFIDGLPHLTPTAFPHPQERTSCQVSGPPNAWVEDKPANGYFDNKKLSLDMSLDNTVILDDDPMEGPSSASTQRGRPAGQIPFEEMSERSKQRITVPLRRSSTLKLAYAVQMKLRARQKYEEAKVIKKAFFPEKGGPAPKYQVATTSKEEALALIVDNRLSTRAYQSLRNNAKKVRATAAGGVTVCGGSFESVRCPEPPSIMPGIKDPFADTEPDPSEYLFVSNEMRRKDQTRQFDSRTHYWLPDKADVYVFGELEDQTDEEMIFRLGDGSTRTVKKELAEPCNPPKYDKCEDMNNMTHLNEASILNNLRERYVNKLIHTYSGLFCVVINPYKRYPLYTKRVMNMYIRVRRQEVAPHIFVIASEAYQQMVEDGSHQSILIT
ncbi:unnamed protein product [Cyprideis torosa]|uniref:Uncharacterized protein n=1 Tax=Cyprideis torosa TaxID=163714 RepID=A0A7R8W4F0_9CRUS|nr:unnamed protein product [Cyprideis torosa]CAG0879771.1 unnamed protein product [Cyprideis torosa]